MECTTATASKTARLPVAHFLQRHLPNLVLVQEYGKQHSLECHLHFESASHIPYDKLVDLLVQFIHEDLASFATVAEVKSHHRLFPEPGTFLVMIGSLRFYTGTVSITSGCPCRVCVSLEKQW